MTSDFLDFTTYLLTRYYNLPQDIKPRGGNAYSTRKGKGEHLKGKGEKIKAMVAHSQTTNTSSNLLSAHASMSAKRKPSKSQNYQMKANKIPWIPTTALNLPTNLDNPLHPIARFCVYTAQTSPIRPKPVTPTLIRRSTTIALTTAST